MDRKDQNTSLEERRVADLIGTLNRVDAPGDFEAHVRSRIAARKSSAARSAWHPLVAGVATAAVIGIGGYVGYRALNEPAPQQVAQQGDTPTPATPAPATPVQVSSGNSTPQTPVSGPALASDKQAKKRKTALPLTIGGSIDEALKDTQAFDPTSSNSGHHGTSDVRGTGGVNEVSVGAILSAIGASGEWTGSGWRVSAVAPQSVADRSTLKAGDVIAAIDGRPLTSDMKFTGSFSGRSLRVLRNGVDIDVPLKH